MALIGKRVTHRHRLPVDAQLNVTQFQHLVVPLVAHHAWIVPVEAHLELLRRLQQLRHVDELRIHPDTARASAVGAGVRVPPGEQTLRCLADVDPELLASPVVNGERQGVVALFMLRHPLVNQLFAAPYELVHGRVVLNRIAGRQHQLQLARVLHIHPQADAKSCDGVKRRHTACCVRQWQGYAHEVDLRGRPINDGLHASRLVANPDAVTFALEVRAHGGVIEEVHRLDLFPIAVVAVGQDQDQLHTAVAGRVAQGAVERVGVLGPVPFDEGA